MAIPRQPARKGAGDEGRNLVLASEAELLPLAREALEALWEDEYQEQDEGDEEKDEKMMCMTFHCTCLFTKCIGPPSHLLRTETFERSTSAMYRNLRARYFCSVQKLMSEIPKV